MDRRRLLVLIALAALPGPALAAKGGEKDKKMSGESSYLPIQTLLGATTRSDGRRGVLTVDCGLDVPNAALRARAEASLPRLRSAYGQVVRAYAAGLPAGYPPNADFIARALQRETDAILGRAGARLLVGAIVVN